MPIKTTLAYGEMTNAEQRHVFKGLTPTQYVRGINPAAPGPIVEQPPHYDDIVFWLDANQAASVFENGGYVTAWSSSKSEYPMVATYGTSGVPTNNLTYVTDEAAGMPAIHFPGNGAHYLRMAMFNHTPSEFTHWSFYVVCKRYSNYAASDNCEWTLGKAVAYLQTFHYTLGGNTGVIFDAGGGPYVTTATLADISATNIWRIGAYISTTGLANGMVIYSNSNGPATIAGNGIYGVDIKLDEGDSQSFQTLGGGQGTTGKYRIQEVIFYSGSHDNTTRVEIEDWLNAKWSVF